MKADRAMLACAALAACAASAATTKTVWTIHENNAIVQWTAVHGDNGSWTWTEGASLDISNCTKPRSACAGVNVIYVADSSGKIVRYDTDGNYVDTLATGLPVPQSICLSPDGTTLYLSSMASGTVGVYRYPISDFSHGECVISSASHTINGPRHIFFGEDGLLYVCSRSSGNISKSGIQAWDVSGSDPVLKTWYFPKWNNKNYSNNGSCCLDISGGRLVMHQTSYSTSSYGSLVFDYVSPENATGDTVYPISFVENSTLWSGISFGSLKLDGDWFAARYDGTASNNKICLMDGSDCSFSVVATCSVKALAAFVDVSSAVDESALASLKARWPFDEPSSAALFKATLGEDAGKYDACPRRWVIGGATGVSGSSVYFDNDDSRLEFLDSAAMVPASGDFSIVLWAGFPVSVGRVRNILNNNDGTQGRFAIQALGNHKPYVFIGFSAGNVTLTGETSISDGNWHQLAFVRRGAKAELWVDGEKESEADFPAERNIANTRSWASGQIAINNNEKAGRMFLDDLAVYSAALSAADIASLYSAFAPGGAAALPVPSAPSRPSENLASGSLYGTCVEHVNALDGRIGAPALHAAADGTLWLAHDYGRETRKPDNNTVVLKSSDGGATWAVAGTNEITGASFLPPGGAASAPAMVGLKNGYEPKFCFGKSENGGGSWTAVETSMSSPYLGSWHPQIPVCWSNRWYVGAETGYASFAVQDGAASGLSILQWPSSANFAGAGFSSLRPGCLLERPDGAGLDAFLPESPTGYVHAAESLTKMRITASGASLLARSPFPGGMKPLCIAYDATGGAWWAAVAPDRPATHVAGVSPALQHRALSLYASRDLDSWRFVTDVVPDAGESSGIAFNDPAIAFSGDSLVLAFGLSAPDGDIGPRSAEESNYLVVRRIAGFRSLQWRENQGSIYVTHQSAAYVGRYSYCRETDELLDGGVFASGEQGGVAMLKPCGIAVARNRLWVASNNANTPVVWEFDRESGAFVRLWTFDGAQLDGLSASPDGSTFFVSDIDKKNCIYRCDVASGTYELFVDSMANGGLANTCRTMVPMPDGTLVFANRQTAANGGGVFRVDSSGALLETLCAADRVQALYWSRKDRTFHMHGLTDAYQTLTDGTLTTLCSKVGYGYLLSIFAGTGTGDALFASAIDKPASLGILSASGYSLRYAGTKTIGRAASWIPVRGTVLTVK